MISDGEGYGDMNAEVTAARAAGIIVRSVSFGDGMSPEAQTDRFGRGNFIPWAGSIMATARPLAAMVAKIVNHGA